MYAEKAEPESKNPSPFFIGIHIFENVVDLME